MRRRLCSSTLRGREGAVIGVLLGGALATGTRLTSRAPFWGLLRRTTSAGERRAASSHASALAAGAGHRPTRAMISAGPSPRRQVRLWAQIAGEKRKPERKRENAPAFHPPFSAPPRPAAPAAPSLLLAAPVAPVPSRGPPGAPPEPPPPESPLSAADGTSSMGLKPHATKATPSTQRTTRSQSILTPLPGPRCDPRCPSSSRRLQHRQHRPSSGCHPKRWRRPLQRRPCRSFRR